MRVPTATRGRRRLPFPKVNHGQAPRGAPQEAPGAPLKTSEDLLSSTGQSGLSAKLDLATRALAVPKGIDFQAASDPIKVRSHACWSVLQMILVIA
eukprot:CAMPEP_0197908224 /NCGR_PEP_ID=MMETSP1439-20131203/66431_1 /TAXON_ID=66791 /ORGANISM="Gonyaulax spinifera, Strain CCMP409" /LENGTH=95 /DNA_ID=CAMNT_0043529701 /DNA_START=82 /DNA_END=366 /DNA_ORIENTATION=+